MSDTVFFLAGGRGLRDVLASVDVIGLDGSPVDCQSVPDLPQPREGAASTVDDNGNVLVCGGRREVRLADIVCGYNVCTAYITTGRAVMNSK